MGGATNDRDDERTLLFADIAGSTRLISEIGDDAARAVLERHLTTMGDAVRRCGGTELDRIGDEILCSFAQPDAAAEASGRMMREVAQLSTLPQARPLRLRIGFAHGPIGGTAAAPFGATVNLAARITARAKPGQILTVRSTLERLDPRRKLLSRLYDRCVLKGIPGEHDIYELLEDAEATVIPRRVLSRARAPRMSAVLLSHEGRTVRVDAASPRAEIGRDPACDLVLSGESVSRIHAIVEWNHGRVQVEDVSTNGTLIEPENGAPSPLRRETKAIVDSGLLRLGIELPGSAVAIVAYTCIEAPPR